jgi:hypothetical protein
MKIKNGSLGDILACLQNFYETTRIFFPVREIRYDMKTVKCFFALLRCDRVNQD